MIQLTIRKKHKFMIPILALLCTFAFQVNTLNANMQKVKDFSNNGQTVYHLISGTVKKCERAFVTASINSIVQCFTPDGKLLWKADNDQDGLDEVLVATGNGS